MTYLADDLWDMIEACNPEDWEQAKAEVEDAFPEPRTYYQYLVLRAVEECYKAGRAIENGELL